MSLNETCSDASETESRTAPRDLTPLLTTWRAGRRLFRVHSRDLPCDAFNPGYGRGRFHPINDRNGDPIPTLYAAEEIDGALSETVFRNVTSAGGHAHRTDLELLVLSRLLVAQDLKLVDLTGLALRRLGLTRSQLIDAPPRQYAYTRRWAETLHRASPDAHGLIWVSRQFDRSMALLLFGDRVTVNMLHPTGSSEPLARGSGFRRVCDAAMKADIPIIFG